MCERASGDKDKPSTKSLVKQVGKLKRLETAEGSARFLSCAALPAEEL
jgi:hypothetical protein